jgi:uncharacterized protein (TIGR02246 family)
MLPGSTSEVDQQRPHGFGTVGYHPGPMKKSHRLCLIFTLLPILLTNAGAATRDEADVLAAVQLFIDGMKEGDGRKVTSSFHPQGRFVTLRRDPEVVQTDTPERVAATVAQNVPGDWDDRLSDVDVRIDDTGMAIVWARYEFFIDGKRSHCGRVLFQLYRLEGRWSIANFADTHSEGHCAG